MSITKLKHDLAYWEAKEDTVIEKLEKAWWTEVEKTGKMNVHDYKAIDNEWTRWSLELKTRRCEKEQYSDTLIWANKLAKAWEIYYKTGVETLFLFQYTDGLFYLNPHNHSPRREFKLQRWDRGGVDDKKGWLYYNTNNLKKL